VLILAFSVVLLGQWFYAQTEHKRPRDVYKHAFYQSQQSMTPSDLSYQAQQARVLLEGMLL